MHKTNVKTFQFKDDGSIPNNQKCPVILYPEALKESPEKSNSVLIKTIGRKAGQMVSLTTIITTAIHMKFLVLSMDLRFLQLGGEQGTKVEMHQGDVVVLPAGTGHKRIQASSDFKIAGAYPDGMEHDLKKGNPDERPDVLENIQSVPLPDQDPVYGEQGPLLRLWK